MMISKPWPNTAIEAHALKNNAQTWHYFHLRQNEETNLIGCEESAPVSNPKAREGWCQNLRLLSLTVR